MIPTRIAVRFFIDGCTAIGIERRSRDFSHSRLPDDRLQICRQPDMDRSSIDFPASIPRTDWSARDIREKSIFTLTSSLSRSIREEDSWLSPLFSPPLTVFSLLARLSISILLFNLNRKSLSSNLVRVKPLRRFSNLNFLSLDLLGRIIAFILEETRLIIFRNVNSRCFIL